MTKEKKYLLEVNAVGTLEELASEVNELLVYINRHTVKQYIEEGRGIGEPFYDTPVMTAEIKEVG